MLISRFSRAGFDFSRAAPGPPHVVRQGRASRRLATPPNKAVHKPFRPHRLATPQALAMSQKRRPSGSSARKYRASGAIRMSPPGRGDALGPSMAVTCAGPPPAEAQGGPSAASSGERPSRAPRLRGEQEARQPRPAAPLILSGRDPGRDSSPERASRIACDTRSPRVASCLSVAGAAASACSGRCASISSRRVTARAPSRAESRSRSSASERARSASCARSSSASEGASGSAVRQARRMRSTP